MSVKLKIDLSYGLNCKFGDVKGVFLQIVIIAFFLYTEFW